MAVAKLLHCPFCGSADAQRQIVKLHCEIYRARCYCAFCGASTKDVLKKSAEAALEAAEAAWNMRSGPRKRKRKEEP